MGLAGCSGINNCIGTLFKMAIAVNIVLSFKVVITSTLGCNLLKRLINQICKIPAKGYGLLNV